VSTAGGRSRQECRSHRGTEPPYRWERSPDRDARADGLIATGKSLPPGGGASLSVGAVSRPRCPGRGPIAAGMPLPPRGGASLSVGAVSRPRCPGRGRSRQECRSHRGAELPYRWERSPDRDARAGGRSRQECRSHRGAGPPYRWERSPDRDARAGGRSRLESRSHREAEPPYRWERSPDRDARAGGRSRQECRSHRGAEPPYRWERSPDRDARAGADRDWKVAPTGGRSLPIGGSGLTASMVGATVDRGRQAAAAPGSCPRRGWAAQPRRRSLERDVRDGTCLNR